MRRSSGRLIRLRGTSSSSSSSLITFTCPTTSNATRNMSSYPKLPIRNCEGNAYKFLEEQLLDKAPKRRGINENQDPFNRFAQKGDTINLNYLLFTQERDYLIKNDNQQVPIHTFENKVVALYFCACTKSRYTFELFEELKLAYEELAQVKKNFEVVLIYGREFACSNDWPCEESFHEEFKGMPWLALPYRDPNCKKLNRIFEVSYIKEFGGLVIFGPHAEFIEPFGSHILFLYKISGYPFSRRRVAQLETEKVKELKLEMICDQNSVFRMKDGSQVPFCQLAGKRILLVLEHEERNCVQSLNVNFLMMLKKLYRKAKGTDHEFEVIRVLIGDEESRSSKCAFVGRMPWLVSHASEWIHANLGSYMWHNKPLDELNYFPVFAFDQDGKLVRRTKYPTIENTCFPFSGCGLEDEALSQLNTHFEWNYWDYRGGSIYSHSDYKKSINLFNLPFGRYG